MINSDLEQKMNAILNSNYSLENKIEQIFFDLKPKGTNEEKINFILYWINLLIEDSGKYEKLAYHDIENLLKEILNLLNIKGNEDYTNYYGKINVIMNKIMNEIISKTNNRKEVLEPSSLISIKQQKDNTTYQSSIEEKINNIKKMYEDLANVEIEHIKIVNQMMELQELLKANEAKKEQLKKDIGSITSN